MAIHDLQETRSASGDGKSTFPTFIAHFIIFYQKKKTCPGSALLREVGCGGRDFKDTT